MGNSRTSSAGLKQRYSAIVRPSETSAQNAQGKNFQKFTCSNFRGFVFCGSYFRVLFVGRENRENLDLAKISRYTVIMRFFVCNQCWGQMDGVSFMTVLKCLDSKFI